MSDTSTRSPHRAWIEVDHVALRNNLQVVQSIVGEDREVIAVVKANAYGHGAVEVAETLLSAGARRLAVATVGEALALRAAAIDAPIIVLWGLGAPEADLAADAALEPIISHAGELANLVRSASRAGVRMGVHLKVDTGLGRQGADPADAVGLAVGISRRRELRLVGTFSHLAVPGEDDAYTEVQLLRFAQVLDAMRSAGVDPGLTHISATGGVLAGAGAFADAVRVGLGLYGMLPAWAADREIGLRPVLALKATPLRLFDLAGGAPLGYGLRFHAPRRTRVATLGIGYGDGWPRAHANNGWALVHGQRAPMVGAISMDGLAIDIGAIDDVTYDDEFVLLGSQQDTRITADEVAAERRTINYEVTTALRERLPRFHLGR